MANQTPPNETDVERIMGQVLNAFVDGAQEIDVPPEVVNRLRQGAIPVIRNNYTGLLNDTDRALALTKVEEFGSKAANFTRARHEAALTIPDFDQGVVEALAAVPSPTPWCREFMNNLGLRFSEA